VRPHRQVVEAFGSAFMDDLAAVHDADLVGKLVAEIELLLDQQRQEDPDGIQNAKL